MAIRWRVVVAINQKAYRDVIRAQNAKQQEKADVKVGIRERSHDKKPGDPGA